MFKENLGAKCDVCRTFKANVYLAAVVDLGVLGKASFTRGKLRDKSGGQVACSKLLATCKRVKKLSSPATRPGGAWGERRYSFYSFLTSVLDGGKWSASRTGCALPRG
jgi:hypothetical protein